MKIVQYGIPRSGTTVIWQILSKLFPKTKIIKTHSFISNADKVVVCVRDFRDILISQYITNSEKKKKMQVVDLKLTKFKSKKIVNPIVTKQIIKKYSNKIIRNEKILQRYINYYKNNCICLKYENFFENFEFVFKELENFFDIKIDDDSKCNISTECNIEKNRKIAHKLKDFNQWDINSLILGPHILNGKPGNWINVIPKELHFYLNDSINNLLKKWRYV